MAFEMSTEILRFVFKKFGDTKVDNFHIKSNKILLLDIISLYELSSSTAPLTRRLALI